VVARGHCPFSYGRGLDEYLIAATADVQGVQLATLNVRHLPCSRMYNYRCGAVKVL